MNLQHERLSHLCTELRLGGVAVEYSAAAQKAAETEASFVDFLETVLRGELETRRARARTMLSRVAGFPAIKTLDQFDFEFAVGAPRQQIQQLAGLSFIERGVRPCRWTESGRCFDRLLGVLILKLHGAEIAQGRVQPS